MRVRPQVIYKCLSHHEARVVKDFVTSEMSEYEDDIFPGN